MKKQRSIFFVLLLGVLIGLAGCGATGTSLSSDEQVQGSVRPESTSTNHAIIPAEPSELSELSEPSELPESPELSEPSEPAQTAEPEEETVTVAINCRAAVNKGLAEQEKFRGVVPADGVILPAATVTITEGETVFSVLQKVTRTDGLQMEYSGIKGTLYIKGINNLYEFDAGPLSGWMYSVNNVYPQYGCGEQKVKNKDMIVWNYTCDSGRDLGRQESGGSQ